MYRITLFTRLFIYAQKKKKKCTYYFHFHPTKMYMKNISSIVVNKLETKVIIYNLHGFINV